MTKEFYQKRYQQAEAQLLQTGRAMICFIEYFAESHKVILNDTPE